MTTVDRVKAICKERRIPISRLERDLGFSNGYIGQLKKGMMPADRLNAVANYLELSVSELLSSDETTKKSPAPNEGEADISSRLTEFFLSLPKDRLRGILLALGAPEELIAELDHQERSE
jgi:transcriptional regulator with XRE-family HTH domain